MGAVGPSILVGCSAGPESAPQIDAVRTVQSSIGEVSVPEEIESAMVLDVVEQMYGSL